MPGGSTREAFAHMASIVNERFPTGKELQRLSCPSAFRRDGTMGYLYVAGGIPVQVAVSKNVLVFLCDSRSHRRYDTGENVCWLRGVLGGRNSEIMAVLGQEIERGKAGEVPYSPEAIQLMQEELDERMKW